MSQTNSIFYLKLSHCLFDLIAQINYTYKFYLNIFYFYLSNISSLNLLLKRNALFLFGVSFFTKA